MLNLVISSCHNVPKHLRFLEFWTFSNLAYIIANQMTPVISLHAEIPFLVFFLTFGNNIQDSSAFVKFHHVMHQATNVPISLNIFQHRANRFELYHLSFFSSSARCLKCQVIFIVSPLVTLLHNRFQCLLLSLWWIVIFLQQTFHHHTHFGTSCILVIPVYGSILAKLLCQFFCEFYEFLI